MTAALVLGVIVSPAGIGCTARPGAGDGAGNGSVAGSSSLIATAAEVATSAGAGTSTSGEGGTGVAATPPGSAGSVSAPGTPDGYSPVASDLLKLRIGPDFEVLPPAQGVYAGVFQSKVPFQMGQLNTYKARYDKSPAIVMWYQPWQPNEWIGEFKADNVRAVLDRGAIPMITWEPWKAGAGVKQSSYRLRKIADGNFDAYIRSWARGAKSVNGPIMIRPFHEMNGKWYPWGGTVNGNTPADLIAAWRHVHGIFEEEGATNVTWVWSINWESYPATYRNRFSAYYPGDEYVDWTSISGFNWGKTAKRPQGRSFANIYTKPLAYLGKVGKPIVISEIACNSNVNKAAWIRDAYYRIMLNKNVKGVVYYDKREPNNSYGTQNWQIASSKSSSKAYKSMISSRMFIGGSSSSLLGAQGVMP